MITTPYFNPTKDSVNTPPHIHSLLFSKFLRMAQPCGLQR
nr:MAG TPA: hypothetical protein [Caudoviricetes sp.]